MDAQRTLVLVKPDGVQRLLVGRVIARFEDRGLKIAAMKLTAVSRPLAEAHYAVHAQRPFFKGLVDFITSGPVVALVLEGPNAIAVVRSMVGATKPHESAPGTIRGDFALEVAKNLIHASDAPETAAVEIKLWFPDGGIVEYVRATDAWILSDEE
jgi:nucleoside-diphosphate kinase